MLSLAALVLSTSTAFAYTNEHAGYMINNKTPDIVMESAKEYGYMNLADKNFHAVSYFTEKEMSEVLENNFTTAVFDESFAKLAILDKNSLDKSILELPLLDLARYGKLDSNNKAVLDTNMQKLKEKVKPEIRIDKIGGKKVITLTMLCKQNGELINSHISLLSANNRLYMLISGGTHELGDKEKPVKSTTEKINTNLEMIDKATVDPAVIANFWKSHTAYVKNFKLLAPTKDSKPVVAYTDPILAKKVILPTDWGYVQYNHNDKKNPGAVSVAIPTKTLKDISIKVLEQGADAEALASTEDTELAKKLGTEALSTLEQVFVSCSVKIDKDKDLAEMLANPLPTKLQADLFFKEGLKHLKKVGTAYLKLNDYKYKSDFVTNRGTIDVLFDVTLLEKYDFIKNLKVTGTPKKISGVIFLNKKAISPDTTIQNIYDKWSF